MARDIDGGRAIVEVDANLDEKSVKKVGRDLKAQLKATDTSIFVTPKITKKAVADLRRDLKTALSKVGINIGISVTKKSLAALRTAINTALEKPFKIDVFVSKANLGRIRTAIKEVIPDGQRMKVKVDVDSSRIDVIASKLGRLFGRGARNNFFNLLGIVVEGTIRVFFGLGEAIAATGRALSKFGTIAVDAFKNSSNGIGGFAAGIAASIANVPGLITTVVTLAAAFVALSLVIGPVVAALISLAGAATAVAVALTGALVAGSTVAIAAMGPLIAIVGSLASAWLLANKQQKDAFKQMIQDAVLDKLKKTILEANDVLVKGLGPSLETVGDVLANFKPAILGVAKSLNKLGEEIANSLDSKEFKAFQKSINKELPEDTLKLGRILSDTFAGFGGTMVSLQPAVDKFLDRIGGAAQSFNDFANSPGGQKSLSDFFVQGEKALGSFGRLLKGSGGLFANLFKGPAGDEGIALIDSFTGKIKELTEFIKANPKKVKDFFEGASDIARSAGDAILKIVNALGDLNTPVNREIGKIIFGGLAEAVEQAVKPFTALSDAIEKTTELLGLIAIAKGTLNNNDELIVLGEALRNVGEDAKIPKERLNDLRATLVDVGLAGKFKISADTTTVFVANQRAKDLLIKAGFLKNFPEIKIKVNSEETNAATEAAKETKKVLDDLAKNKVTVRVEAEFNQAMQTVLQLLSAGVINNSDVTALLKGGAVGGIMKGGNLTDGGKTIKMASGGIVTSPTFFGNVLTGEAGPEAIVPLRRPLSQVDPSVRGLSAVAQGKAGDTNVTVVQNFNGPTTSIGRVREADWAYRFSTQARGV